MAAFCLVGAAACGPEGSNATDRARVDEMLASDIIAHRPLGATVTIEATGKVSESSNDQFAAGGDNGAVVRLEVPRADLDAVALEYVDLLQRDGWSEIVVECLGPSPRPTTRLIARTWVGYETAAIITLVERGASIETRVVLRAPFHDSRGTEPDPSAPPDLDCLEA